MIRRLFDLSGRQLGDSAAGAFAAVETWLAATVAEGGTAAEVWGAPADTAAALARKRLGAAAGAAGVAVGVAGEAEAWAGGGPLRLDGNWKVTGANWDSVFRTVLARRPRQGLTGPAAKQALGDARAIGGHLRLVEFSFAKADGSTVQGMLGAVVEEGRMYLFDPRAGLYFLGPVNPDPISWFRQHMAAVYGAGGEITARTFTVPVTDVFITWFGPPSRKRADDGSWPDLKGVISLARGARLASGGKPRITLCCLAAHRTALTLKLRRLAPDIADGVDVRPIENLFGRVFGDRFEDAHDEAGAPAGPDFTDLRASVGRIMTRSMAASNGVRGLVTAKDVWSLYCLYEFGGYFFDAGVILGPGQVRAVLPEPGELRTMWFDKGQDKGRNLTDTYQHVTHPLGASGVGCVTLTGGVDSHPTVLFSMPELTGSKQVTFEKVDVGEMSSRPRGHGTELALRVYIELWYRLEREKDGLPKGIDVDQMYGSIVATAAATALAHPKPVTGGCGFVAPKPGGNIFLSSDLGLLKTGGQTHRKNPIPLNPS